MPKRIRQNYWSLNEMCYLIQSTRLTFHLFIVNYDWSFNQWWIMQLLGGLQRAIEKKWKYIFDWPMFCYRNKWLEKIYKKNAITSYSTRYFAQEKYQKYTVVVAQSDTGSPASWQLINADKYDRKLMLSIWWRRQKQVFRKSKFSFAIGVLNVKQHLVEPIGRIRYQYLYSCIAISYHHSSNQFLLHRH